MDFSFKVINASEKVGEYSSGCSGSRSDCCTRVCTRYGAPANPDEWNKFLELNAGVVQY